MEAPATPSRVPTVPASAQPSPSPSAAGSTEAVPASTSVLPTPVGPLVLRKGDRVRLGYRTGRVEDVRGNWVKPYDVRIRWEGDPRPEYVVYGSLALEYRKGRLARL
jgi:hypothetical protein